MTYDFLNTVCYYNFYSSHEIGRADFSYQSFKNFTDGPKNKITARAQRVQQALKADLIAPKAEFDFQ